ncbi:MAG: TIGR04076 family protein [Bacillota bacterium]
MKKVTVVADRVNGTCSANIVPGDRMVFEGANLNLTESTKVCPFALSTIYPIIFAARLGYDIANFGMKEKIVQCIDPGPPLSEGGTVFWKITAE